MMCESVKCERNIIVPLRLRICDLSESNLYDSALKICRYQFFFVPLHAKCVQTSRNKRWQSEVVSHTNQLGSSTNQL